MVELEVVVNVEVVRALMQVLVLKMNVILVHVEEVM